MTMSQSELGRKTAFNGQTLPPNASKEAQIAYQQAVKELANKKR